MMQLYLIAALLFALCVSVFAIQNAAPVEINFLLYQFKQISLVIVILVSVLLGALIVFLLSMVKQVSLMRRINSLEKRNQCLEKEMEELQELKLKKEQKEENKSSEQEL